MKRVKVFLLSVSVFFGLLFFGANNSLCEIIITDTGDTSETNYGSRIDNEGSVHFVVYSPMLLN